MNLKWFNVTESPCRLNVRPCNGISKWTSIMSMLTYVWINGNSIKKNNSKHDPRLSSFQIKSTERKVSSKENQIHENLRTYETRELC